MKAILFLHLKEFFKVKYFIVLLFLLFFNIFYSLNNNKIINFGLIIYIFFLIVISERYNGLKKFILTTGRDRREYFFSKFYLSVISIVASFMVSIIFKIAVSFILKELINRSGEYTYIIVIKQISIYLMVLALYIISENSSNKINMVISILCLFLFIIIKTFHLEFLLNVSMYFKNLNISFVTLIVLFLINYFVFKYSKSKFMKEDFI